MRIAVDLQALQGSFASRGIGIYTARLIEHLQQIETDLEFVWYTLPGRPFPRSLSDWGTAVPVDLIHYDRWLSGSLRASGAQALHITCPFDIGPIPDAAKTDIPIIATIYDLIPLKFPYYLDRTEARRNYMARIGRLIHYQRLLSISHAVRDDIIDTLGIPSERVSVIGGGVEADFRVLPDLGVAGTLRKYGIAAPYVMCTGGDDPRKNLFRLVDAFGRLPRQLHDRSLVIVCGLSDSAKEALKLAARLANIQGRLILTGYVSRNELIDLYNGAEAFVFPSVAEGFGLPVLEAMACGTPVVASERAPMTEVGGDAAVYADPMSPAALAGAMAMLLENRVLQRALQKRGLCRATRFSWKGVAERTLQVYREVAIPLTKMPAAEVRPMGEKPGLSLPTENYGSGAHRRWPGVARNPCNRRCGVN